MYIEKGIAVRLFFNLIWPMGDIVNSGVNSGKLIVGILDLQTSKIRSDIMLKLSYNNLIFL